MRAHLHEEALGNASPPLRGRGKGKGDDNDGDGGDDDGRDA